MILEHQQTAYNTILETARAFFGTGTQAWKSCPIQPRFNRLMTGPSGSGKTAVVKEVAVELGLPLFAVSASSWMVLGSSRSSARNTWSEVMKFCATHKQGIIFLDEIDKVGEESTWMTHLRVEIFSLLDHLLPASVEIDADEPMEPEKRSEVEQRLRESFLIIGAGAFQRLWEAPPIKSLGFHSQESTQAPGGIRKSQMQTIIPTEIANRFASPTIELPMLRKADYQKMAHALTEQIAPEIRPFFTEAAARGVESAVQNNSGCRWLEELMLEAVIALQKATQREVEAASTPAQPAKCQPATASPDLDRLEIL